MVAACLTADSLQFLENIYFTFLFIARAVSKMKTQLLQYPYDTGKPTEDHRTRVRGERATRASTPYPTPQELVRQVLEIPLLCSPTFDESLLFRNSDSHHLREDLRSRFKNISQIMDCVECETCKVHAKLQMLGIGTALKILLPSSSSAPVSLQPNEVIACVCVCCVCVVGETTVAHSRDRFTVWSTRCTSLVRLFAS